MFHNMAGQTQNTKQNFKMIGEDGRFELPPPVRN